jgi:PEP-CTERM motif
MLTGPLAGVSGGIGLDPSQTSDGKTTITPVAGGFRIDSFFDEYVELTLNTNPPINIDRGPQVLTLIPEPGTVALLGLPLAGLFGLRRQLET